MVYEGTMVVYHCIRRFNSKYILKKERVIYEFKMDSVLQISFLYSFNLSNDDIISLPHICCS